MTTTEWLTLGLGMFAALCISLVCGIVKYALGAPAGISITAAAGALAVTLGLFFAGVAAFR